MSRQTRRSFLKRSAAAIGATVTVAGSKSSGKELGSNDRIRIAVAGIHGRGKSHISAFAKMKNVEIAYLVDPDSSLFDDRSKMVEEKGGNRPKCVQDIREVLDDKNLDAVSVATCNHWHSPITIWACQAGKDVYVEKPLSHNVREGRIAVQMARKNDRIVQHGTQRRSDEKWHNEIAAVRSGKFGKLLVSKGYCCKKRWSIGNEELKKPPSELDFNIWLGPAPEQSYHENLVHYGWHWFWDFGNGDIGNQGVHQMDICHWALPAKTRLPKRVFSLGGRFAYEDQGQTPNTLLSVYDFGEELVVFETRGLVDKFGIPKKVANEFYTTEGMISDNKFHPKNGGKSVSLGSFDIDIKPGDNFENFILAVRSRKRKDLNADVLKGHYAAAMCHLGNISYRLGEIATWDGKSKAFGDNKVVAGSLEAIADNLRQVQVPIEGLKYNVGRVLDFDPKKERFLGDEQANALLTRQYRKPFTIPDAV